MAVALSACLGSVPSAAGTPRLRNLLDDACAAATPINALTFLVSPLYTPIARLAAPAGAASRTPATYRASPLFPLPPRHLESRRCVAALARVRVSFFALCCLYCLLLYSVLALCAAQPGLLKEEDEGEATCHAARSLEGFPSTPPRTSPKNTQPPHGTYRALNCIRTTKFVLTWCAASLWRASPHRCRGAACAPADALLLSASAPGPRAACAALSQALDHPTSSHSLVQLLPQWLRWPCDSLHSSPPCPPPSHSARLHPFSPSPSPSPSQASSPPDATAQGRFPGWQPLHKRIPKWSPCCNCFFSAIPDALLLEIFRYLPVRDRLTAAGVCTRWNYVAESPALWRGVDVQGAALRAPASCAGLVRLLSRQSGSVTTLKLRKLGPPALDDVDYDGNRDASPSHMAFLGAPAGGCDGSGSVPAAATAEEKGGEAGGGSASPSSSSSSSSPAAFPLASLPHFTRLVDLDLSGSVTLDALGAVLPFILAHRSSLRSLTLDGMADLSDDVFCRIVAACPGLQRISVAGCRELTDASLLALTEPLPASPSQGGNEDDDDDDCAVEDTPPPRATRLTELVVRGCWRMTEAGLLAVVAAAAGLPHPAAAAATAHAAAAPASPSSLPPSFFSNGQWHLSNYYSATPSSRLRVLDVRGVRGVSDTLLLALARWAPRLSTLDAGDADPFGTTFLAAARSAASGRGSSGALALAAPLATPADDAAAADDAAFATALCAPPSSWTVTDAGLSALANAAGGLTSLRLAGRGGLSDAGVAGVLSRLPQLEVLDLRGCLAVGDRAAAAAARWCGGALRELRLTGSRALSPRGFAALTAARPLRRLALLDTSGCAQLAASGAASKSKSSASGVVAAGAAPAAAVVA